MTNSGKAFYIDGTLYFINSDIHSRKPCETIHNEKSQVMNHWRFRSLRFKNTWIICLWFTATVWWIRNPIHTALHKTWAAEKLKMPEQLWFIHTRVQPGMLFQSNAVTWLCIIICVSEPWHALRNGKLHARCGPMKTAKVQTIWY